MHPYARTEDLRTTQQYDRPLFLTLQCFTKPSRVVVIQYQSGVDLQCMKPSEHPLLRRWTLHANASPSIKSHLLNGAHNHNRFSVIERANDTSSNASMYAHQPQSHANQTLQVLQRL